MPTQILFIDAYDSFSNNIVALLRNAIPDSHVSVIKIDDPRFFSGPKLIPIFPSATTTFSRISQCLTPPSETDPDNATARDQGRASITDGIDYAAFYSFLSQFDAVVAGPGPGHPSVATDIGVVPALWQQPFRSAVPVLGICLGFQSLAQHAGLVVQKLPEARHGLVVRMEHQRVTSDRLFEGVPVDDCIVTVYHSLGVKFGRNDKTNRSQVPAIYQADGEGDDAGAPFWDAGKAFIPLAWDTTSQDNGPVLMALKSDSGPFWGVQYHPESVCTNSSGQLIIQNWWNMTKSWNNEQRSKRTNQEKLISPPCESSVGVAGESSKPMVLSRLENSLEATPELEYSSVLQVQTFPLGVLSVPELIRTLKMPVGTSEAVVLQSIHKKVLPGSTASLSRPDERDRFSVLGIVSPDALRIFYSVRTRMLELRQGPTKVIHSAGVSDIWAYLTAFMAPFSPSGQSTTGISGGSLEVPFWGGLMGFISYEAGLESLGITPTGDGSQAADVAFVFVHRSVVVDHYTGIVSVQSILPSDLAWIDRISRRIQVVGSNAAGEISSFAAAMLQDPEESPFAHWLPDQALVDVNGNCILPASEAVPHAPVLDGNVKTLATRLDYSNQVKECQELICEGESYELCLTGQVGIQIPVDVPVVKDDSGHDHTLTTSLAAARRVFDWKLYDYSSSVNPAPYSAFVRLDRTGNDSPDGIGASGHGFSIVSCSPEKFLSWTRDGKCQMRPIKGTLGKWDWTQLSKMLTVHEIELVAGANWNVKEKIPSSLAQLYFEKNIKERAENLMIVDLIRHDLNGVARGGVEVPGCMVLEEYAAVYQLVSVIEAELKSEDENEKKGEVVVSQPARRIPMLCIPQSDNNYNTTADRPKLPTIPERTALSFGQAPTGLSVLAVALPPGSMTGAPKLRSCQLLSQIEGQERGVYSGVLGYLDVGGCGHFNVVIRTGVRWDWECEVQQSGRHAGDGDGTSVVRVLDTWHVGAGGAITAKSDPDDEVDEMMIKARSTLRMFGISGL